MAAEQKSRGKKILLVEDEEDLASLVAHFLTAKGYDVTIADTLSKATELRPKVLPDVVILDVFLPDGNGLNWLRILRMNQKNKDLPVIILSGHGSKEDIEDGMKAGANDYLVKPARMAVLLEALEKNVPESGAPA